MLINREMLIEDLLRDEGLKLKPYKDSKGILSIGVGRNLEADGINQEEAYFLLKTDIDECIQSLSNYPIIKRLSEPRQRVLIEMAFNLGIVGLMRFHKMWAAIQEGNWDKAADEMLDSKWAKEVGQRAVRLEIAMRLG